MAQINARDYIFEASVDPTAGTPVWARIGGVESFDLNLSEGEESTETTTFESEGNAESQAMQRGASLSIEGKVKRNGATPDAGQAAVEELAGLMGEESLGGLRFRHKDETSWVLWTAWASLANQGGGNNDKTSWGATFTRSGAGTEVPVTP